MKWHLLFASLILLGSCSTSSGGRVGRGGSDVEIRPSDLMKVTYIRFNFDPKKKRYYPVYQILISETWKRKYGSNPVEPYSKLFPKRGEHTPYFGIVPDPVMRSFQRKLYREGLSDLASVSPEEVDLVALSQVRLNKKDPPYTRILTVGDFKGSRSWQFLGNNYAREAIQKFVECEKLIIEMVSLYATKISIESLPVRPGNR